MVAIRFLGAAGTVTGSKYLVTHQNVQLLIDCGLFQGDRMWREYNWQDPVCAPSRIQATLLTHAHVDHIGMLPRFHQQGLTCPVWCTAPTTALAELILPDSARLQEEEAAYRARTGKTRHHPPLPLYTEAEARSALGLLKSVAFDVRTEVLPDVFATWYRMGHVIGAAGIRLEIGGKVINFSGDIGRYDASILCDPKPMVFGDLLLIESTYGGRYHDEKPIADMLASVVNETVASKGVVLIPSFAVGRTQQLLYTLRELKLARKIPADLPIIVDSPMATDATTIYARFSSEYDLAAAAIKNSGQHPFSPQKLYFVRDQAESKKLNSIFDPMIIISASGMLSGGRILHHLRQRISNPRNTLLFVGFQPPGSRGAWIKSGAESLRIFSDEVSIRARIREISGLSAHADHGELLRWCRESRALGSNPGKVAIVHGEQEGREALKTALGKEFGMQAGLPEYLEEWTV